MEASVSDSKKSFYTVVELAEAIGMSQVTIRNWLAERRLSYVKFGKNVRIPTSELERLIAEGTIPARRVR